MKAAAQCSLTRKKLLLTIRQYECGNADQARISEQCGHCADSADIFVAIFWRKSQIWIQPAPYIAAIERAAGVA
jgi:hypothetical protein